MDHFEWVLGVLIGIIASYFLIQRVALHVEKKTEQLFYSRLETLQQQISSIAGEPRHKTPPPSDHWKNASEVVYQTAKAILDCHELAIPEVKRDFVTQFSELFAKITTHLFPAIEPHICIVDMVDTFSKYEPMSTAYLPTKRPYPPGVSLVFDTVYSSYQPLPPRRTTPSQTSKTPRPSTDTIFWIDAFNSNSELLLQYCEPSCTRLTYSQKLMIDYHEYTPALVTAGLSIQCKKGQQGEREAQINALRTFGWMLAHNSPDGDREITTLLKDIEDYTQSEKASPTAELQTTHPQWEQYLHVIESMSGDYLIAQACVMLCRKRKLDEVLKVLG